MDRAVKHRSGRRVKFRICTWKSWWQLHGVFLHEGVCTCHMSIYVLTRVHARTEPVFLWWFLHKVGKKVKKKKFLLQPPPSERTMIQCAIWFTALHLYLFFWQSLFSKAAYDPCLELSSWSLRSLLKGLLRKCWDLSSQPSWLEDSFVKNCLEPVPESV